MGGGRNIVREREMGEREREREEGDVCVRERYRGG